jgi:hypothetical protein
MLGAEMPNTLPKYLSFFYLVTNVKNDSKNADKTTPITLSMTEFRFPQTRFGESECLNREHRVLVFSEFFFDSRSGWNKQTVLLYEYFIIGTLKLMEYCYTYPSILRFCAVT